MLDRGQLKTHGIRYARSLLMVFKTINMFSAEHNAAAAPIEQSYNLLNAILKETGQFTIGFVDQRIMLNNILTTEKSLQPLENEFLKRGIAAVTFQAGLTQGAYKRGMAIIARSAKVIEESGGIAKYLHENPAEMMRVFPAGKNAVRNESGDTILDSDSESFLMAKAIQEMRPSGGLMDNLERMLHSSGLSGAGMFEGGSGNGNEQSSSVVGLGGGGSGTTGNDSGSGFGAGVAAAPTVTVNVGGPQGIQGLVENYFDSSVLDAENAPQRSYVELAKAIQEMRPEMVLSNFSPQRREQLRQLPPEQMAAEVIEDSAVKWAVERMARAPQGADAVIVEEEVIRVLLRSLQATQAADRLARKLAQYVKDLNVPASTTARIQEELDWVVIPAKKKTEKLLAVEKFDRFLFRRLLDHIADSLKLQDQQSAEALALHYCGFLDKPAAASPEDLGRIPEVARVMSSFNSQFLRTVTPKLCFALGRDPANQFTHVQIVNAIGVMAKALAVFEDFDAVEAAGRRLEQCAAQDSQLHVSCCVRALESLLSKNGVERVIELSQQRKDDPKWTRTAVALIRWSGQPGITRVFQHLEYEPVATNRIALLRFISKIGPAALDVARARICHERWYVVRNACKLLADLKDPDLLADIAPALRHEEERVQMAAVKAIFESRHPDRAPVLAAALPVLRGTVRDHALDDLIFLKDPKAVRALQTFIFGASHGNTSVVTKAIHAVALTAGEAAEAALYQILIDQTLDLSVRTIAYEGLCRLQTKGATHRLLEFSRMVEDDPLARTARESLAWAEAF